MTSTRQPRRILVYGLLNPKDLELFYIGQTRKRREFRLLEHIEHAIAGSALPVHEYIRKLMDCGRIPEIFVIERVSDPNDADETEIRWIRHYSSLAVANLPVIITPQTPKSTEVTLRGIKLQNVRHVARQNSTGRRPSPAGTTPSL